MFDFTKLKLWRARHRNIQRPHFLVIGVETVNALSKFPEIPYPRERAVTNGREWGTELSDDELRLLATRARQCAANLIATEARDGVRTLHGPPLLISVLAVKLAEMQAELGEAPESAMTLNCGPAEAKTALAGNTCTGRSFALESHL